ncbi:MAG: HIT family protein [Myxococcales bacterium]|nr:HIT family protein [Myxococcales bacterium]
MGECVFCDIISGAGSAAFVAEDDGAVAFLDLRQAVLGHVLVVPRRHIPTIYELSPDEGATLMSLAVRVARAVRDALEPAGLNLWQSNGAVAGQEVDHLHLHVHPRRADDGIWHVYPQGLPAPAAPERLADLAMTLRAALPA